MKHSLNRARGWLIATALAVLSPLAVAVLPLTQLHADLLDGPPRGAQQLSIAPGQGISTGGAPCSTSTLRSTCTITSTGRLLLTANTTYFVRTVPSAVTISNASPAVVTQTQTYAAGQLVTFNSTGTLPTGLTAGTVYCVLAAGLSGSGYEVSATCGGSAINTSSAGSGTFTVQAGNDLTGNGSAQTATQAFMTLQGAANYVAQNVDSGGTSVTATIQAACSGGGGVALYSTGVQMLTPFSGSGNVQFLGDTVTPSNCQVAVNGAADFQATYSGTRYSVGGFDISNAAAAGAGLYSSGGATLNIVGNMQFGVIGVAGTSGVQVLANDGNVFNTASAWTVSGGSGQLLKSQFGGHIENATSLTITMTGTPAFANTALATDVSHMNVGSITTSGSCTGQRYAVTTNADIFTNSGGANYFCGTVAGATATGGIYQ